MATPALGKAKYEVGSTAFVPYEGGTHYPGRIQKREIRDHKLHDGTVVKMWYYLVHYMGWNKKYDEWVEETGVRESNPDEPGGSVPAPKGRGKMGSMSAHAALMNHSRPQMSIAVPAPLKKQLIDEQDAVKDKRIIPLPRPVTVADILAKFVQQKKLIKASVDEEEQVVHGLRNYFDRCLVLLLLYADERAQADDLLRDGLLPSTVYGAEHLLRLFVKLPDYLPVESITEDQYKLLQRKLHDVLEFLSEHQSAFFLPVSQYKPLGDSQPMDTTA